MTASLTCFATCPRGVERLLATELREIGAERVAERRSGVAFAGSLETAYRACLWSRTASRVLLALAEPRVASADDLYAAVRALSWEEHLAADGTLAVDYLGDLPGVRNTMFGAQRVKDAIVDRFRERTGTRPDVETTDPDLRVNVSVRAGKATVAIDLAGQPLHRRGYREPGVQVEAPLKENLAAALVLLAGWRGIAEAKGVFVDPMCGSGTLPIEAAMIAGDRAPGLLRDRFGFERLLGHDADVWERLLDEADARAETGAGRIPLVVGSDRDVAAIEVARTAARRAGLGGAARFEVADVAELRAPEGASGGLVLTNPPYGERLVADRAVYAALGERLRSGFDGWTVAVLTGDEKLANATGVAWKRTHALKNGPLDVALHVGKVGERAAAKGVATPVVSALEFTNRLRKNVRHLRKWARREGVTCFRVYDADLPDFAVAIDLYEGAGRDEGRTFAYVAEYEAPPEIDPALAEARLRAALEALPEVLGVSEGDVFVKVRRRQRGTSQYERQSLAGAVRVVAEGGSLLEVNLSDYLDTGLFLDMRPLRLEVRRLAQGKRFLNLYSYTGAFTVHAAAGGAASTLSVDLSQTYTEWAQHNMELNGLVGPRHQFVCADAMQWLARAAADGRSSFDVIICDPPTFSASKRMDGTLDVQRDHAALIRSAARLLVPGGVLYFSTNLRSFALDADALAGLAAEDITPATIPPDFARRPRVHSCWRIVAE